MIDTVSVETLNERWQEAQSNDHEITVIDVRGSEEYVQGHMPVAKLIALNTLPARADEIAREGDVYLICRSGMRSMQAAQFLANDCGYKNVINVTGGTMAWVEAGFPVEEGGV